jgi:glycosyltransferase involved in cell wall biosynthesis
MNVAFYWEPIGGLTLQHRCNPYAGLLAQELDRLGVHLELGDYTFDKEWLEENRERIDVLHFHWLHYFYRRDSLESTVRQYGQFSENLAYAKKIGYRVVWTLHNLYPHERPYPDVDHLARLLVSRQADHVITHCDYGRRKAEELFYRSRDISTVAHGNFIDVFPNEISREDARAELGIAGDAFVYVYFGNARTYKGIEDLIDAFSRVEDPAARLLLMMRNSFNPKYGDEIVEKSGMHDRVLAHTSEYFPESAFQTFLNAADVGVLPFSQVMTSGSAIQALGFGLPVIVPDLGCLSELVDDTIGVLYDASDGEGLARALSEIRTRDVRKMGEEALERAKSLDWASIASRTARIYGHRS